MRSARLVLLAPVTATTLLALAVPAFAHVTVHSADAVSGGTDAEIVFRTPNEQSKATTTQLAVQLPADAPLAGVLAEPKAGWKVAVTTRTLVTPIVTDDGTITSVVATVTWTATAGGTPPGQYDDFAIAVGKLPDATRLVFKALQTYSDGTVVRWIEPTVAGQPEPDHPAPALVLGAATSSASSVPRSSATPTATATSTPMPSTTTTASDSTGRALGGVGLGVGVLGLLLGGAAFVRSGRSRS